MKYALSNKDRIEATPKAKGICQCCGSELVAKCGTQKIWHWAHKGKRNCDHWWENETQWHRDWKDNFPKEWQEVVHLSDDGEKHIADVKTPNGLVVEFQHSAISLKEKLSRETFYKDMIWVVDGRGTSKKAFKCPKENFFDEDPTTGCAITFDGEYLIENVSSSSSQIKIETKIWNLEFIK